MCLLLALHYDCFFRQLLLRQLLLGWLLLRLLLPRLLLFRWLLFRLLLSRCQLLILTKLSQEKLDAQATLTFYLLVAQASSFLIHPFRIQSIRLHLVTYPLLCNTCMAYRTSCHSIGHQEPPTQHLPREAEDFPRGGKHSKHVLLLKYLA